MKKSIDFNKKAFANYMALYPVNEIRVHVIVLVLLGADVFVLLPAFANPFSITLCIYSNSSSYFFKFVGDMDCYQSSETTITIHSISGEYMAPYVQSDYWL